MLFSYARAQKENQAFNVISYTLLTLFLLEKREFKIYYTLDM